MIPNISFPDEDEKNFWPIVLVRWVDSSATTNHVWYDLENALDKSKELGEESLFCYTAGIMLHEDDNSITVALSVNDTQCGNLITIPKVAVKSVTVLDSVERKDDL